MMTLRRLLQGMSSDTSDSAINRRFFIAASALAILPVSAMADVCPPDKKGENLLATGPSDPVGVKDEVLASIDLSKEKVALADHTLRTRRLEVEPQGVVPWHSHADRPAMIYMLQGELTEHTNTCSVPVVLRAGQIVAETHIVQHWWKNEGKEKAVVLSFDILHDPKDTHMM